ncbi:MAG TPA: superoxide dismutase [Cu-Zn] SodC [Gammaproteobacteria bacterium]|nr:superoxide dismutase [Cu-Zn] SodC [Gammaproteobacteria bacterium]
MKNALLSPALFFAAFGISLTVHADYTVQMNLVDADGVGKSIGQVTVSEAGQGTLFTPSLSDLPPGMHGFHVHAKPSCEPAEKSGAMEPAEGAGSHYEADKNPKHAGPSGDGHRGDLPVLAVASDGTATQPVLAPRLKLNELAGKSLMIHAGGDNYSDKPHPSGGGGKRIACGIIK